MADDWRKQLEKIRKSLFGGREPETPPSSRPDRPSRRPAPEVVHRPSSLPPRAQRGARSVPQVDPEAAFGRRPQAPERVEKPVQAPKDPLPLEPRPGTGPRVNIGIDLGTSTTKVCARSVVGGRQEPVYALSLGSGADGGAVLCPTTITLLGERLYFGSEAEARAPQPGARVLRQLKVCVGCEVSGRPQIPLAGCASYRDPRTAGCTAMFAIGPESELVLASELLTLFLAWAMRESARGLPRDLTGGQPPRLTYCVGAPLDQMDVADQFRATYQDLVFDAWRLSDAVDQGLELRQGLDWLRKLDSAPRPPAEELPLALCSEARATIAAYALSPEMQLGLFGLVDLGAWTTDISIFRLTDAKMRETGVPTLPFFSDRSHRTATNEVDERWRRNLLELFGCRPEAEPQLAEALRGFREQASIPKTLELEGRVHDVRSSALAFARDIVAEAIHRHFIENLFEAQAKEIGPQESKWRGLTIFASGGGANEGVLLSGIESHDYVGGILPIPKPGNLRGAEREDYRRLNVAYGLAFPSALWPREIPPSQIAPYRARVRRTPTYEDLGLGK